MSAEPVPVHTGSQECDSDGAAVCGERVPLIDQQALDELEEDFHNPTVVRDFVRDFAQSWEGKYQRLASSVHHRDRSRAKEAALSVKVTSIMVGAMRLAHLAARTEQLVDCNDMHAAARMLVCVEACGSETRTHLLQDL